MFLYNVKQNKQFKLAKMKTLTPQQICNLFGCTLNQLLEQFIDNADIIYNQWQKALSTGKKVDGATAEEHKENLDIFKARIVEVDSLIVF